MQGFLDVDFGSRSSAEMWSREVVVFFWCSRDGCEWIKDLLVFLVFRMGLSDELVEEYILYRTTE